MAPKLDEYDDVAQWPSKVENYFIDLLHEEAKKGLQTSTLDKKTWNAINNAIFSRYGMRYTVPKLKSKYNRLRKNHRDFSELLSQTGMGWDPTTKTVLATEEVWEAYLKKNSAAKRFRKKGLDHYEELGVIFNNTTATGQLHYASSHGPPDSQEERHLETEFVKTGAHVELDSEYDESLDGESGVNASGTRRRPVTNSSSELSKKESKNSKSFNLEEALYSLSKSLNAKAESSLARAERRREIEEQASSKSDPYSVAECMQTLQSMPDIGRACFLKAMEKFMVPEWRQMFITMTDERRHMWLESLVE